MRIQQRDEAYFKEMNKGDMATLSDAQTRLVIKAEGQRMLLVTVDCGIVCNIAPGIKKSDFLTYGLEKAYTHLIELKGKNIDAAFEQLRQTVGNVIEKSDYSELVENRDIIDAYIVSPGQQTIPRGNNKEERKLAELLARRSRRRVKDMFGLIHYVKVVPRQRNVIVQGRRIICSGTAPLELE